MPQVCHPCVKNFALFETAIHEITLCPFVLLSSFFAPHHSAGCWHRGWDTVSTYHGNVAAVTGSLFRQRAAVTGALFRQREGSMRMYGVVCLALAASSFCTARPQ